MSAAPTAGLRPARFRGDRPGLRAEGEQGLVTLPGDLAFHDHDRVPERGASAFAFNFEQRFKPERAAGTNADDLNIEAARY